jgi:hypothetical protein
MTNSKIFRKTNIVIGVVLLILWALFANRYYGPTDPLTSEEMDQYMEKIQQMFIRNGVPDGNGKGTTAEEFAATLAAFRQFGDSDDGKPIYMINMMKWRDQAIFNETNKEHRGMTVEDADHAYTSQLKPILAENWSHIAYLSKTIPNAVNIGFYDGDVDDWGEVGIFRYSSRRDFMNMMASEKYQAMMHFKLASMGWIAIVPSQPHDLMFNPMPNTPVLLGFVFIIGYLIVLLLSTRRKK